MVSKPKEPRSIRKCTEPAVFTFALLLPVFKFRFILFKSTAIQLEL
jgi:hypothetical protein